MAIRSMTDEADVLVEIASGDERSFTKLFMWYARPLGEFVQRLTGSLDLTEEIIQDVFVIVWQRRDTLPRIDNFSGYLFVLCRNHTFATLKKVAAERARQLLAQRELMLEAELEELDNPAAAYREKISKVVDTLPEQQRRAYSLSRYERMKYEEIANTMGISIETVKKHIQLAVLTIKRELGDGEHLGIIVVLTSVFPII